MPCYRINQFWVQSALPLPCPPVSLPADLPEADRLTVACAPGSLHEFPCVFWAGRRYGGDYLRAYDVGEGLLICAGDEVRLWVDNRGRSLTLDFDADDALAMGIVSALTVNLGMALCTFLRGDLPLHAAGVELDGKLIGLSAPSGTGKSTLLWSLLDQGARFAGDDVLPVKITRNGVLAFPSVSLPAKLSRQALERRGLDGSALPEVIPGTQEFWLPIEPECRLRELRPLAALCFLHPYRQPEMPGRVAVRQVRGGEAISLLLSNLQGFWAVSGKLAADCLRAQAVALLRSVPLYILEYHRRPDTLPGLIGVLHEVLSGGPAHARP